MSFFSTVLSRIVLLPAVYSGTADGHAELGWHGGLEGRGVPGRLQSTRRTGGGGDRPELLHHMRVVSGGNPVPAVTLSSDRVPYPDVYVVQRTERDTLDPFWAGAHAECHFHVDGERRQRWTVFQLLFGGQKSQGRLGQFRSYHHQQ